MSTMLSHNATVPLWGFILIIGVGSIMVIGGVSVALRYWIKHHESNRNMIESDPETVRRLTVRRGRVVPQSHYMSLTGSRFGLGAFGIEDSRSGARSKSPFEWLNNAHARSSSQMSQLKSPTSNHSQTPEPIRTGDTLRKHAPSPLRSAASLESISEKPPSYTFPSRPASAHRSLRTKNFSRPALDIHLDSVTSLPQIVETSPHQSMISSHQSNHSTFSEKAVSTVSELKVPRSPASFTGSRTNSHADLSSTKSEEPPFDHHPAVKKQRSRTVVRQPAHGNHPARSASLPRSPRPADNGCELNLKHTKPHAIQTGAANHPMDEADRRPSLPQSPRRSTSTLNLKRLSTYREPGDADNVAGQLSDASLQALPQLSPATDPSETYWESRQDLQPVRRKSGKGKVLRKKSLQRAERASWLE